MKYGVTSCHQSNITLIKRKLEFDLYSLKGTFKKNSVLVAFTFWKEPVCFQMSVKILVSLFTLYYALRPLYLVLRDLTFAVPWGVRSCDFHYLLFHQLGAAVTHSQLFLGVLIFPHISLLQLFVIDPAVSRSFHLPQSPLCQKLLLIVPGKPCPQLLFFFFFFLPEHLCLDDSKFLWPSFDSHVLTKRVIYKSQLRARASMLSLGFSESYCHLIYRALGISAFSASDAAGYIRCLNLVRRKTRVYFSYLCQHYFNYFKTQTLFLLLAWLQLYWS